MSPAVVRVSHRFDYALENRKSGANRNADFLSRLPEPTTEHNRSGSSSLTRVNVGRIFLIRACELHPRFSPTPGVGFGGLVARPENAGLGGLPTASSDLRDFRAHRSRMNGYDPSALCEKIVACVSATVTIVDPRPTRRSILTAADIAFTSIFAVPFEGDTGSAEAPADVTDVARHAPSATTTSQGADLAATNDPAASAASPPGEPTRPIVLPSSGRISARTCGGKAAGAGAAPPAVNFGFGPGGAPRWSARRAKTSPRVSRPQPPLGVVTVHSPAAVPAPTEPISSGRDRADSVGAPLLRRPRPHDAPSATTADLDALGATAELKFGDSAAR